MIASQTRYRSTQAVTCSLSREGRKRSRWGARKAPLMPQWPLAASETKRTACQARSSAASCSSCAPSSCTSLSGALLAASSSFVVPSCRQAASAQAPLAHRPYWCKAIPTVNRVSC